MLVVGLVRFVAVAFLSLALALAFLQIANLVLQVGNANVLIGFGRFCLVFLPI